MNPSIELFTNTGRMITSDPPLQNLDHKIRLKRSWRLSLAEEMEADVSDLKARRGGVRGCLFVAKSSRRGALAAGEGGD